MSWRISSVYTCLAYCDITVTSQSCCRCLLSLCTVFSTCRSFSIFEKIISVSEHLFLLFLLLPLWLLWLQVHVRGGETIPMQEPALTTTASRLNPYSILVALDESGNSSGVLYLDDGESLSMEQWVETLSCSRSNTAVTFFYRVDVCFVRRYALVYFKTSPLGVTSALRTTVINRVRC